MEHQAEAENTARASTVFPRAVPGHVMERAENLPGSCVVDDRLVASAQVLAIFASPKSSSAIPFS
jgi:hypothetical protein